MDLSLIYSKSSKGGKAVLTKCKALSSAHLAVLSHVDGKTPASSIFTKLKLDEEKFSQALTLLLDEAYIQVVQDFGPSIFDLKTAIEVSEITTEDFLKLELPEEKVSKTQEQIEAEARARAYAEEQARKEAQAREQEEAERKLLMVTDILATSGHKIDIEKLAQTEPPIAASSPTSVDSQHLQGAPDSSAGLRTPRVSVRSPRNTEFTSAEAKILQKPAPVVLDKKPDYHRSHTDGAGYSLYAVADTRNRVLEPVNAEKDRLKREQAELHAQQLINVKARKKEERRTRREQEETRKRTEQQAREEARAHARAEAKRRTLEEAERKARERADAELKARETRERRARERAELAAKREFEAKTRAEAARKRTEEARVRKEALAIQKAEQKEEARRKSEARAAIRAQEWGFRRARIVSTCSSLLKTTRNLARPAIITLAVMILISLGLIQFASLSMWVEPVERVVATTIDEPVSIRKMHASLWPMPHLVLEEVSFGHAADISARTVHVYPALLTLLKERKKIRALEIGGFSINQEALGLLPRWLASSAKQQAFQVEAITFQDATIKGSQIIIPAFDADIVLIDSNAFNNATLTADGIQVNISPKNNTHTVEIRAHDWAPPTNPALRLEQLSAKGTVTANQIDLQQIEGRLFGGTLRGELTVDWASPWKAEGRVVLAKINLSEATPAISEHTRLQGKLHATVNINAQADALSDLRDNANVQASFEAEQGEIGGMDLARAAAGRGQVSGATRYEELSGHLTLKNGRYSLTQLVLMAGTLKAHGDLSVSPQQELTGRIQTRLDLGARKLQNQVTLGGTVNNVRASR